MREGWFLGKILCGVNLFVFFFDRLVVRSIDFVLFRVWFNIRVFDCVR